VGGEPPDLLGALESHVAAKTQLEAQLDEFVGLLGAAVESVRDAGHPRLAQMLEQPVGGTAHVQDHRQSMPPRQRQLPGQEQLLARRVGVRPEKIQADFADRNQAGIIPRLQQGLVQAVEVRRRRGTRAQRVDAQCIAVAVPVRELAHRFEIAHLNRRQDAMGDAGSARASADRVGVGGELRRIQVAVCVNPRGHGTMMPQAVQARANRDTVCFRFSLSRFPP